MKKIVILGPESTGKTVLSEQLAAHYNTLWCPEFAREYLLKKGNKYSYDDLLIIAKGQLELEDHYLELVSESIGQRVSVVEPDRTKNSAGHGNDSSGLPDFRSSGLPHLRTSSGRRRLAEGDAGLLFIDTNMYVMQVWCEFVFGKCHRFILDQVIERKYDLYLLCNTDLPWLKDELREYPDLATRDRLYKMYKDILVNQSTPWAEITGNDNERLQKAITAVDTLL